MNWSGFWTVFFLATFKFVFSTIPAPHIGMSFLEAIFASFCGGTVSSFICYFASDGILLMLKKRKKKKEELALANDGYILKRKKVFTKTNRFIVRVKRRFGKWGICIFAPFFLSVPLGSMVAAKFYGKEWDTFPRIMLGMAFNASLMSCLVFYVFN